jgi:hypothetical protein
VYLKGIGLAVAGVFVALGLWTAAAGASGLYADWRFLRSARIQNEQSIRQQQQKAAQRPQAAPDEAK